jgi:hypothetical protein
MTVPDGGQNWEKFVCIMLKNDIFVGWELGGYNGGAWCEF